MEHRGLLCVTAFLPVPSVFDAQLILEVSVNPRFPNDIFVKRKICILEVLHQEARSCRAISQALLVREASIHT